jgi:large subunit ribosomal protein L4
VATIDVYNLKREKVGQLALDDTVFGVEVREHLYYEVAKAAQARSRAGTASTKTRGEIAYSTAKMFKQKGTGNARRGSRRAPGLRGGGIVFGPRPRDYGYRVPRKMRRAALCSALSGRIAEQRFIVVEDFELTEAKTKGLIEILKRFEVENALIVDASENKTLKLSARNLQKFKYLATSGVNVMDVLRYDNIIMTKSSVEEIEGALKR